MNDCRFASRVLKEAESLVEEGCVDEVLIAATPGMGLPEWESISERVHLWRVPLITSKLGRHRLLLPLKLVERRLRLRRMLRSLKLRSVHAHSVGNLADAVWIKKSFGVRMIYDCHELETDAGQAEFLKVLARASERRYIHQADSVLVVSAEIASWYADQYKIAPPVVVRNIPSDLAENPEGGRDLRRDLGISPEDLVYISHGRLTSGRAVEVCLRVWPGVPKDRHIVFMGYGPLEGQIRSAAQIHPNIHFYPAVHQSLLGAVLSQADVGICLIEPIGLSYRYALPNKLFESLSAGLPILSYVESESIKGICEKYRCGWSIGPGETTLSAFVTTLHRDDVEARRSDVLLAGSDLSWSSEAIILVKEYRRLGLSANGH